jgi:hypothetical protein
MDIAGASSAIQAFQYAPRAQDSQTAQAVPRAGDTATSESGSSGRELAAPPRETGRGQLLDITA